MNGKAVFRTNPAAVDRRILEAEGLIVERPRAATRASVNIEQLLRNAAKGKITILEPRQSTSTKTL